MKKSAVIASILYENAFAYALMMILLAIVVYLMQSTSSMVRSYYEVVGLAEASAFQDKVLVDSSLEFDFYIEEDIENRIKRVSEMSEVHSVNLVGFQNFWADGIDDGTHFLLDPIVEGVYEDMRYSMVVGEWPDEPMEIALAESMRRYYKIGETIPVSRYHFSGPQNDPQVERVNGELKVVGFLHMDAQMIEFRGFGNQTDLSQMATTLRKQYESFESDKVVALGVGVPTTDASGQSVGVDGIAKSLLVVPEDNVSPEELKMVLSSVFPSDNIYIGQEVMDRYHVVYRSEYESMIRNILIVASLALSTLFSSVFLQLRKKKAEMTVYYMCGLSWQQSIGLFCTAYIPIILLSFVMGSAVYIAFNPNRRWFDGQDSGIILLILLGVSVLFVLPLYIVARRSSPIEQNRKD